MPTIRYLPDEIQVDAGPRQSVLHAAKAAGIPHTHVCGGNARCSTCRIIVLEGLQYCAPRNPQEKALADRLHFGPAVRLACQTVPTGDVTVRRLVLDAEDVAIVSQLKAGAAQQSALAGDEKNVVVLFADIRGFTALVEAVPPYDVVHILNRYFHKMEGIIRKNGGYVNNFMGDGLMAVFEVDGDPGEAALRCAQAGLQMLGALDELNPYVELVTKRRLQIGIGAHCGEAVVGSVGSGETKRTTAIGDCVNYASRVEAATKEAAAGFLISEDMYWLLHGKVETSKTVRLTLPGKTGEYTLYEVLALG